MLDLIGTTPFNTQDVKIAGMLFFKKLLAANQYTPANKFNGKVKLIKAADNFVSLNQDYNLSEVRIETKKQKHRRLNLRFLIFFYCLVLYRFADKIFKLKNYLEIIEVF